MISFLEERPWSMAARDELLIGSLALPHGPPPMGVALLAADRGCSRQSPARRETARALRRAGFATLMVDLITVDEQEDQLSAAALRIDTTELERRLHAARVWAQSRFGSLPLALIGFDGAGAAVLQEAADRPDGIWAVVVDSSFPDYATHLAPLRAPVLFIAETGDVSGLSRIGAVCDHLQTEYGLATVRGARSGVTPIARAEAMGRNAAIWLANHLPGAPKPAEKTRALPRRAG